MMTSKSTFLAEVAGKLSGEFSNCQDVAEFGAKVKQMEKNSTGLWRDFLAELESQRKAGGSVHQFEVMENDSVVTGVLVIKEGEIAKRFEFGRVGLRK